MALIPSHRLYDWIPGITVGVQGGIPTNRTNKLNLVSGYGADNTGATDTSAEVQAAIDAASTNDIVWAPCGVYRCDSGLASSFKDDFTIAGEGYNGDSFVLSRTTNTIGTGSKTFTVPAGLGYTTGCGVWVWKWDRNDALITSITRSGGTATVTTAVPHLRATGETVTITGAIETDYNGDYAITVTGASTFTYTVANSPSTPATTNYILLYKDSSLDGPNMYMKGTVASYSDTTLVVDVDSSLTSGTWSMWKCSLVVFDFHGGASLNIGGDNDGIWFLNEQNQYLGVTVEGSPAKGDTSFVVSGWDPMVNQDVPVTGQLAQVAIRNQLDANAGAVGDSTLIVNVSGTDWSRRQMLLITNVTGSGGTRTITFTPPLAFDLPAALEPKFHSTSSVAKNVGLETICLFFHDSSAVFGIRFHQTVNCWVKGVSAHAIENYNLQSDSALFLEVRRCWLTHRKIGGTNGAAFLIGCNSHLLIDSVIGETNFPAWEVSGYVTGGVGAYCYCPVTAPSNNHGPWPSFNLYEGNVSYGSLSDGYFGGNSCDTYNRNYCFGVRFGGSDGMQFAVPGNVGLRRWSYNMNVVGNVMGTPNYTDGDLTAGLPNIGNGDFSGHSSCINGDRPIHLASTGGIPSILTTRTSDTAGVLTMDSLTQADIEAPNVTNPPNYNVPGIRWAADVSQTHGITIGAKSGATVAFTANPGTVLPEVSTAIQFWIGQSGFQEFDDDVEDTRIQKGNWLVSGSGGSQTSLGGDTLEDSYLYASKPSFFGDLTWPPVDPASPTFSKEIIPAAYRYLNGTDPGPPVVDGTVDFSGPGSTTFGGSGTVTFA